MINGNYGKIIEIVVRVNQERMKLMIEINVENDPQKQNLFIMHE